MMRFILIAGAFLMSLVAGLFGIYLFAKIWSTQRSTKSDRNEPEMPNKQAQKKTETKSVKKETFNVANLGGPKAATGAPLPVMRPANAAAAPLVQPINQSRQLVKDANNKMSLDQHPLCRERSALNKRLQTFAAQNQFDDVNRVQQAMQLNKDNRLRESVVCQ